SSEHGKGSTFTLYLPLQYLASDNLPGEGQRRQALEPAAPPQIASPGPAAGGEPAPGDPWSVGTATDLLSPSGMPERVEDDRLNIRPGDQIALIVENDISFAGLLKDLAQGRGF